MLSKIVIAALLILGFWLPNFGCDAQTKKDRNETSISVDEGHCRLYAKNIKFFKLEGEDKSQKKTIIYVEGKHLNVLSNSTDPPCGNRNKTETEGRIELEYQNITDDQGNPALDTFILTWTIQYLKRFGWWEVTELNMTAMGPVTNNEEIRANFTGAVMKSMAIGAASNFSYACSKPNKLYFNIGGKDKPTYGLQFEYLSIQPFAYIGKNKNFTFTENVDDCVAFFSAEVWMYLTTLLIFVSVILFGVIMLANMTTVNRFDDPKAKALVISAKDN